MLEPEVIKGVIMASQLDGLETKMEDALVKNAPFQIPEKGKETLVSIMPWLSLVGGVLGLLAAKGLWDIGHYANNRLIDSLNQISRTYGYTAPTANLGVAYWLAFVALVGFSLLDIIAFPGLRARSKSRGWNIVFYGTILSVVYSVVLIFVNGRGVGSFIWSMLVALVSFYLLFQVRSSYNKN